jgi:hypothetical protein
MILGAWGICTRRGIGVRGVGERRHARPVVCGSHGAGSRATSTATAPSSAHLASAAPFAASAALATCTAAAFSSTTAAALAAASFPAAATFSAAASFAPTPFRAAAATFATTPLATALTAPTASASAASALGGFGGVERRRCALLHLLLLVLNSSDGLIGPAAAATFALVLAMVPLAALDLVHLALGVCLSGLALIILDLLRARALGLLGRLLLLEFIFILLDILYELVCQIYVEMCEAMRYTSLRWRIFAFCSRMRAIRSVSASSDIFSCTP